MSPFRTESLNQALERTLSRARLEKYLAATEGDLAGALALYERNTALSEALYTPLQSIEICLRNTIDRQMIRRYGPDWLTGEAASLLPSTRRPVDDAVRNSDRSSHGDIVSQLRFSFWVSLLGPTYDQTLWRQALHLGFREGGGRARRLVHGRMNAIRRFRNRVAHHEPIFERCETSFTEILEAIGWMCSDTRAWTERQCRFPDMLRR